MSNNIRNKTILNVAGISVFAAMFCMGCYDLGLEPSVKTPTIETFVDMRDGHVYKKVKIGEQTWMAENLKYEAEGSVCYYDTTGWTGSSDPELNCEAYGRLYDWYTAMNGEHSSSANPSGVEGVCPVGWHLPSNAEWTALLDYVGENSGTKLKSHEFHRNSDYNSPEGTDIYNFSALPGGLGIKNDDAIQCGSLRRHGYWWSATEMVTDTEMAWVIELYDNRAGEIRYHLDKHRYFLSVRCVHDYD